MSAKIFNITELERTGHYPLSLEFYGGNILDIHSDVMLMSSFKANYFPLEVCIFSSIACQFGYCFTRYLPEGSEEIMEGLIKVNVPKCRSFDQLWILEISALSGNSETDMVRAIKKLESVPNRVALQDIKSISMPLIGTGYQKIDIRDSAQHLMKVVKSGHIISVHLTLFDCLPTTLKLRLY